MARHITILGWLYAGFGVLGLLSALAVFGVFAGIGLFAGGLPEMPLIWGLGGAIAMFVAIMAVPNLLVGAGLVARWRWARIAGIVLGVVNLFNAPFGTLLGIYTFWVLFKEESVRIFQGAGVDG